jgi:integrase
MFACFLGQQGLKYGTIKVYLSGFRSHVLDLSGGQVDVLKDFHIKQTLRGIHRSGGDRALPKHPITAQNLLDIIERTDTESAIGLRDVTAFVVAFFGFLRRSEVVQIQKSHVVVRPEYAMVFIPASKTDQFGVGMWIVLARREDLLCPVSWLEKLLNRLDGGKWLFRGTRGQKGFSDNQLSFTAFNKRVKEAVKLIGLNPKHFAGHSFRRGGATAAAAAGVPGRVIKRHGRWASDCYERYVEESLGSLLAITRSIQS